MIENFFQDLIQWMAFEFEKMGNLRLLMQARTRLLILGPGYAYLGDQQFILPLRSLGFTNAEYPSTRSGRG